MKISWAMYNGNVFPFQEREVAHMMQQALDQHQEEEEHISAPATPVPPTSPSDRPCHECVEEECPAPVECLAGNCHWGTFPPCIVGHMTV